MITRRALLAGAAGFAGPGGIEKIEHRGVLIQECSLAGDRRGDDSVPAHPNGIQVSRDKWMLFYATRKFRGTDDDASIVAQLRGGAPDGKLIRERMISRSIDNWDPFGEGKEKFVRQHGHPVAFGVPKGALIGGKPAPHANLFVLKWRVVAKVLDRKLNSLVRRTKHDEDVAQRTQNVEWMQVRLNQAEDDFEIVQQRKNLRQKGYESGPEYCSLPGAGPMNQTFVQAVPYNADLTEWADTNHFGGTVAALKYRFNPRLRLYEWVETGPGLFDIPASEASLLQYGDRWLVAGRQAGPRKGIAWAVCDDPFRRTARTVIGESPAATAPLCAYTCPDGVVRVMTGDATVSPRKMTRDPMYAWEVDPDRDFRVIQRHLIYDSVEAGLPIRRGSAPKVDMCKLLPHSGRTQTIVHRVSVRAFNHPYLSMNGQILTDIPIINAQEKNACAIYYATITYRQPYPSPWEFARA